MIEQNKVTRYALVVGVAKRAREIQARAEREGRKLSEKPVILAADDIYSGRVDISEI